MVFFGNVRLEVEPFEESQGAESPKTVASPDELKAFYSDMERQEIVQRNLSRRKSGSTRSLFSRKTVPVLSVDTTPPTVTEIKTSEREKVPEKGHVEEIKDQVPSMQSRSIIPDQLQELPAWYTKEGVNIPFQKMRYPMHNPVGPRRYINHHLLPSFRSTQLHSIFSPSFPPMAPMVHEASQDSTRASDPNRTPSGSPLPTPTSSETRIADNGGRRSRKTSQTAHDTVDLLDVSDPWGTNWHHQSPYDIGLNTSPVSPDVPESSNQTRSRVSSMTTGQRRKTMPSPLSQSTSAIHVQVPDSGGSRKLSKRRKPVLGNLFRSHSNSVENGEPKAVSPPATPIEDPSTSQPPSSTQEPPIEDNASKQNSTLRQSINVPSSAVPQAVSVDKKVKRGSVLGRLARRFSIMKKPLQEPIRGLTGRDSDDWHHVAVPDANSDGESRRSAHMARQPSPEKQQPDPRRSIDPIKRIPPPSLESGAADRSSSISVEAPFSIGRLTIANPDTPIESAVTPNQRNTPLPPDLHPKLKPEDQRRPSKDTNVNPALPADSPVASPDSPLQQSNIHPSPAPPPGVDKPTKQQSPSESAEVSLATDYLMSKLLPDPFPSPTRSVDSPEILKSPAAIEDHIPRAIPELSTARPTQSPVGFIEVPVVNTRDSKKAQRLSPSAIPQTQSSADSRSVSRAGPPVSESRARTPASGLTRTRLVKDPAERTSGSGRPRSVASPPVASAVPFPFRVELLPTIPSFDPIRLSAASMVVDSPLSAASMFVHPPTPHDSPELVPIYAPPLPSKSLEDRRSAPQDISTNKVKNEGVVGSGRQTETFKLIRSASGNLYPLGNTIIAAGQQWEVVESDVPHRNKAREKLTKSKESGSKEKVSKEKVSRERAKEQETKERESKERESKERESKERDLKERDLKERDLKGRDSKESDSKDQERGSRREQRRQDRSKDTETEVEQRRTARQRNGRVPEHSASASSSSGRPRTRSADIRRRPETQEHMLSSQGEHKPSRRRDEDRERRSERGAEVAKPLIQLDASKPQPPPPPPTPRPLAPPKLERQSSTSNRPTSELPSTAELNSLKARDVWEMERLWKGRSMYGVETNGSAAPASISSQVEVPPGGEGRDNPADGPSHGSSHTSFMVQTPFQVPPSSSDIYHSMPSGPPPVIYPATSSLSQFSYHPVVQNYANNHRSSPASISLSSQGSPPSSQLANPLPEPPRESQYTPSTLSDSKGGRSTDYWTKYAGVTKAH